MTNITRKVSWSRVIVLTVGLAALSLPAQAEVYRWVDANGKVHFSDRKPLSATAEDVSGRLKKTNIDTSQQEHEKLGKIFAKETEAERRAREREQAKALNQKRQLEHYCKKLKRRIDILNGPTYWVDNKGNEREMSLEEQKNAVAEAQQKYNKRCK